MTNFYDEWLRNELWTFKEAAMLFNGMDPQYAKDIGFKYFESTQMEDWKKPIFKTYKHFLRTDWSKWDPHAHAMQATHRDIFIQAALDKDIPFSDTLKLKYVLYIKNINRNKGNQPANRNLTEKSEPDLNAILETLEPELQLIRAFGESEYYSKHGLKTPQKLISTWIDEHYPNVTRDEVRVLKGLITRHYGITTARN